jgi:hypothetical protein
VAEASEGQQLSLKAGRERTLRGDSVTAAGQQRSKKYIVQNFKNKEKRKYWEDFRHLLGLLV